MRLAASLVAFMLATTGCSDQPSRYDAVADLAQALRDEHLGCVNLSQPDVVGNGEGSPTSSGTCSIDGEGVQLFVFETDEDADLWFSRGRMEYVPTARGANWVVVTNNQGTADRVADALGGSN